MQEQAVPITLTGLLHLPSNCCSTCYHFLVVLTSIYNDHFYSVFSVFHFTYILLYEIDKLSKYIWRAERGWRLRGDRRVAMTSSSQQPQISKTTVKSLGSRVIAWSKSRKVIQHIYQTGRKKLLHRLTSSSKNNYRMPMLSWKRRNW